MFVADIVLTRSFPLSIVNVKPFIYKGYTNYYVLRDEWTDDCDDLYTTGRNEKVVQCAVDFSNKLLAVTTLSECESTENTYYVDKSNQAVYIHTPNNESVLTALYDYALAFGVSTNGVQYINDDEYLPIVKTYPEIQIQDEAVGQKQPTGIVASLILNNLEYDNNGTREGVLDFILEDDASVYGNDIILYNYENGVLEKTGVATVNDFEISLQSVTLSLTDERMK
jgi:hypothetical protein